MGRRISSYVVDEIRSDLKNALDPRDFAQFMENTRQLAQLIATSAQQLELCPELAVSTFPPSHETETGKETETETETETEVETAVELENYPFPITKGCYLAIERNYSSPFPAEMRRLAVLAADFCRISLVLTQLKSSKIVPISVIPTIAQMVPFWVISRGFFEE